MLSIIFLILYLCSYFRAILTLTRSSLHRHSLTRSLHYFYKVTISRLRIPVSCNTNVCYSEGCACGRNQVRRHEARFSVLLRISRTHRKVTHTALIYSACHARCDATGQSITIKTTREKAGRLRSKNYRFG